MMLRTLAHTKQILLLFGSLLVASLDAASPVTGAAPGISLVTTTGSCSSTSTVTMMTVATITSAPSFMTVTSTGSSLMTSAITFVNSSSSLINILSSLVTHVPQYPNMTRSEVVTSSVPTYAIPSMIGVSNYSSLQSTAIVWSSMITGAVTLTPTLPSVTSLLTSSYTLWNSTGGTVPIISSGVLTMSSVNSVPVNSTLTSGPATVTITKCDIREKAISSGLLLSTHLLRLTPTTKTIIRSLHGYIPIITSMMAETMETLTIVSQSATTFTTLIPGTELYLLEELARANANASRSLTAWTSEWIIESGRTVAVTPTSSISSTSNSTISSVVTSANGPTATQQISQWTSAWASTWMSTWLSTWGTTWATTMAFTSAVAPSASSTISNSSSLFSGPIGIGATIMPMITPVPPK